jgi:hypothetical protein
LGEGENYTHRRRSPWLLALGISLLWMFPANAEWSATLPVFRACSPATPPELPARWRAVGLLMPFEQGQLDVGEFVYDAALPAMRATVYGLESGAVDLLITQQDTYVIHGAHGAPTYCTSLGPRLRPPSPQWLAKESVCLGQFPVASHTVQWWKKLGFDAARYWVSTDTRLPWRSLFLRRTFDPPIVGDYAMTYFAEFTPLPDTKLATLRDLCAKNAKPLEGKDISATPTARELMALGNEPAENERKERIGELIPGLTHKACAGMKTPRWPDRFITTAVVTPIQLDEYPYSTLIYYNWSEARTQLILPFHGYPPVLQGILSLKDRVGYRLHYSHDRKPGVCAAALPGIVRPDWMSVASCQCKAVVDPGSPLGTHVPSQILECPIKMQSPRIMWSWYTTQDEPIMFVEAEPEGTGVMLADYDDWIPGQSGQPGNFDLPKECVPADGSPEAAGHTSRSIANVSCSECHTTPFSAQ